MPEFNLAIFFSSLIAGILTFFAPCTLPLIPAFLGIISGSNLEDFKYPEKMRTARWWVFKNALLYVVGFSIVFIIFGVVFSLVGQIIMVRIWLSTLGGFLVMLFGLFLTGLLKVSWLSVERRIFIPHTFSKVSLLNSFVLGALFAMGWSPCVGPLLGSVLLLASTSGTVIEGTFLLFIFCLGLGIPFLITSLLMGRAFSAFSKWGKTLEILNKLAGVFLIILGILLMTGEYQFFIANFKEYFYSYPLFEEFINNFL